VTSTFSDRDALQLTRDELGPDVPVTDRALALLNSSTFTPLSSAESGRGYAWAATMTIGDVTLSVESRGDTGSNWYVIAGQPLDKVDEIESLVRTAMPDLGEKPLDRYCEVLEFYLLNRDTTTELAAPAPPA
jgi:hypothetical protein